MRKSALWCVVLVIVASGCGRESGTAPAPQGKTSEASTIPAVEKEISFELGGGVRLELILIPAGEFKMGSPDSDNNNETGVKPQHRVRITKPFYLGTYLLRQEQWEAVMGNNPSYCKGPKNPVESVSWEDCQKFLGKLNEKFGARWGHFQLPTEAQGEYACRAGSITHYCFGDDESGLREYAWYDANSGEEPHPVGGKRSNAWGLYDVHGNLWEWCADWYDSGYYAHSPMDDPTGPTTGSNRVGRGGCWNSPAKFCQSASRNFNKPGYADDDWGLRVSLVPAAK